jgi:hypothetical protein
MDAVMAWAEFNKKLISLGLSSIDERFLQRLSKKNLVIGENGAGKTRFLKALEEYYRENADEGKPLLFPLYCSDLNIVSSEREDGEGFNADFINGALLRMEPKKQRVTINTNTVLRLFDNVATYPSDQGSEISNDINKDLETLLHKKLSIRESRGKRELEITRKNADDSGEPEKVLLVEEWNNLSPGERIIIYFFLLYFYLKNMKNEISQSLVILIDEPEVHLHPKILIDIVVEKLLKIVSSENSLKKERNWRIYIASHSVFLIPFFQFEEHIYIKDGQIKKKTSTLYQNLCGDLIGLKNENENKSLFDFLSSVYDWNYASYLSECFTKPGQVEEINTEDKQFVMFLNKALAKKISGRDRITVLDYGCGTTARIGQCLAEKNAKTPVSAGCLIVYSVYDAYEIDENVVNKKNIAFLDEVYKTPDALKKTEKRFDIVVLLNVLHEMDICNWQDEINLILSLLKDDGCLFFSERAVLSKGESPYGKSGYLVLATDEVQKLFGIQQINDGLDLKKESVVACLIEKKNCPKEIASANVENALDALIERTETDIFYALRNKPIQMPRHYAFLCQQYFNARHANELIKGTSMKLPDGFERMTEADIAAITDLALREFCFAAFEKLKGKGTENDV